MHIPQAKLKSINNKTTERGAHLLLHCRSSPNQLHLFVRGWNIYSVHRVVRQLKICFCLCPFDSVPVCRSPNTDLKEMLKVFRNRSAFLSPPPFLSIPHSLLTISLCSVVAMSLCGGEACMCILTRAMLWFPPFANTERLLPCAADSYK